MEIDRIRRVIPEFIKKYRYALLVLLVGIVLMLIPERNGETGKEATQDPMEEKLVVSVEQQLSALLSQMEGAGSVKVLLTESKGQEILYQTDGTYTSGTESSDRQVTTVILSDHDRNEIGLIRQANPPQYQGAIILCQGADSPSICLAMTEAVSKVTGLGADSIVVLKMG